MATWSFSPDCSHMAVFPLLSTIRGLRFLALFMLLLVQPFAFLNEIIYSQKEQVKQERTIN